MSQVIKLLAKLLAMPGEATLHWMPSAKADLPVKFLEIKTSTSISNVSSQFFYRFYHVSLFPHALHVKPEADLQHRIITIPPKFNFTPPVGGYVIGVYGMGHTPH